MKIKVRNVHEGVCPVCDYPDVEYVLNAIELSDPDTIHIPIRCRNCGFKYTELYDLNFAGFGINGAYVSEPMEVEVDE